MKLLIKEREENDCLFLLISENEIILEIKRNGDFLHNGKLIENDKEIVEAFKEFLINQRYIN